jgi:hypothetical protein
MSIADNFNHGHDDGFVRSYDAQAARRQFQVSLILVVVLAVSAIALGIVAQLDRPDPQIHPASAKTNGSHFAETLLDNRS